MDNRPMTTARRFLVLAALMFWLGGFMFYGAVVVPIARETLTGSQPGTITRKVTPWINLAGTVAVLVMFVDVWASRQTNRRWRWVAWLGMALPLPLLVWLHGEMSRQMTEPGFPMDVFLKWHRAYLLINTAQWFAGMVFTLLSLRAWRAEDRA